MNVRNLGIGAILLVVAVPGQLMAHADQAHKNSATHDMKAMPAVAGSAGTRRDRAGGHAATLGRAADAKTATRTVEIDMDDHMRFSPSRIEIRRGDTVRFVARNNGQARHEFVIGTARELKAHAALMQKFPEMEHDDPNAVSVDPGKSGVLAWTFTKTGAFAFACLLPGHFEAGMKGTIVVKPK